MTILAPGLTRAPRGSAGLSCRIAQVLSFAAHVLVRDPTGAAARSWKRIQAMAETATYSKC